MSTGVYDKTIKILAEAGVSSPRLEARMLMAHVLKINADSVCGQTILSQKDESDLQELIQKRLNGMPIDKILGHKEFYKYDFITSQDVLSPRPDTEILLMVALDLIIENELKNVLDLGVGSGCLLLSLLKEIKYIQGIGVDISSKALSITKQNAKLFGVENRCVFVNKSWFDEDFVSTLNMRFDLIVSNPPYIKTEDIKKLDVEVRNFDPLIALDGGKDGLKDYIRIAEITPQILNDDGYIALEVGINQAAVVQQIFESQGLKHIKTTPDLSGIERVVLFQK